MSCTSKCNCYIVYYRRPRETRTYRRRQLFSSTCRIQTRIRNEIYAPWEKNPTREQSFLKRRAVSISILGRHLWHTQPSQLREQRTWSFARTYTCNTFLASHFELNITHICGSMLTLTLLRCMFHTDITPTLRGDSGSVRKANRAYHFPAGKCKLHSSTRR